VDLLASAFLEHEARALLTRLQRIQPFVLSDTMVPAAGISPAARRAIEAHLGHGRDALRAQILGFIETVQRGPLPNGGAASIQRRFALLRLRFNGVLTQFDLFADALGQRAQRDSGVWLAGLDALAEDALAMPGRFDAPPLLCYLDRGIGAAIRRARTRLPGGGANPVAVIRVPRERLVGSGIASSLVHEVGHQAAALLGLVASLRAELARQAPGDETSPWRSWERWVSEIVADLWSIARLGIAAVYGLIGVLSLPSAFVFRIGGGDPHPPPWLRVLLACAIGRALYPQPQWEALAELWRRFYPPEHVADPARARLERLAAGTDAFVALLLAHRCPALGGSVLGEAIASAPAPRQLRTRWIAWQAQPARWLAAAPCTACAVLGQARADGRLGPELESRWVARLLTHWAVRRALDADPARAPPERCAPALSSIDSP
jgi:hypothetical protein